MFRKFLFEIFLNLVLKNHKVFLYIYTTALVANTQKKTKKKDKSLNKNDKILYKIFSVLENQAGD